MNQPLIYVDIDDVLAESTRACAEIARRDFAKNVKFEEMSVFDLRVSLSLAEHEYEDFMNAVHTPRFLEQLPVVKGARKTLEQWIRGGAEINLLTGRPPSSQPSTLKWLKKNTIPYNSLEFVDKYNRHANQGAIPLQELNGRTYDFVIEDSFETASYLAKALNTSVLLFDRPWNRQQTSHSSSIERVHNWAEIENRVNLR